MASKIIQKTCPNCNKVAVEVSRVDVGEMIFVTLACKHTIIMDKVQSKGYELTSSDGRELKPFQVEGIQFAEQNGVRVLIADEMGLGKTVQALGILKLHPELLPAVIFVKSKLKQQWFGEVIRWCGTDYLPQIVTNGKTSLIPGFPVYIVSMDMLRRMTPETKQAINVKTVIIDECQGIKNHLSQRAKEIQAVCKDVEHIICLSGTPIKNNAGEYFTVLNLLQPRRFPQYANYIRTYCDSYDGGWGTKVGGLRNAEMFHEDTKDFIIRRTWDQVDAQMPKVARNFRSVELDKKYEKAYALAQSELEDMFYSEKDNDNLSMIEKLTKMRHIVGWNKIDPTVEYLEEFLLDTTKKIVVFTHHLDVTEALVANIKAMMEDNQLNHLKVVRLAAGNNAHEQLQEFENNPNARIAVASTLAAGEGLNMQFCSDIIIMERQWNPANEEQVEGRIKRIGQTAKSLQGTYMIAAGTIDEFFTELVEQKRAICASTLDNKEIEWNEQSLMAELLAVVAAKGGRRWKLK